jgi:hypothetical protein
VNLGSTQVEPRVYASLLRVDSGQSWVDSSEFRFNSKLTSESHWDGPDAIQADWRSTEVNPSSTRVDHGSIQVDLGYILLIGRKKDLVARWLAQTKHPIKCLILPGCCLGVARKNRATSWQLPAYRSTGQPVARGTEQITLKSCHLTRQLVQFLLIGLVNKGQFKSTQD